MTEITDAMIDAVYAKVASFTDQQISDADYWQICKFLALKVNPTVVQIRYVKKVILARRADEALRDEEQFLADKFKSAALTDYLTKYDLTVNDVSVQKVEYDGKRGFFIGAEK